MKRVTLMIPRWKTFLPAVKIDWRQQLLDTDVGQNFDISVLNGND